MLSACTEAPAAPDAGPLLLDWAGPQVQLTAPASAPPDPLRVVVRRASDLDPVQGAEVRWDVLEGTSVVLSTSLSRTDSAGLASAVATVGTARGRYRVRARVGDAAAVFEVWAVDPPQLDSVPATARPGDTIRVVGRNFSPDVVHDVVLLGGVRATVTRASSTELAVEVPPCLPEGPASLRVALGSQSGAPRTVRIAPGAAPEAFAVGQALTLDGGGTGRAACRRLPAGSFIMVLAATGTVSGARTPGLLRTLADFSVSIVGPRTASDARPTEAARAPARNEIGVQERWDAALRERERSLLGPAEPTASFAKPSTAETGRAVPRAGDRRDFDVLQPDGRFRRVSAVVRWVGASVALYEDTEGAGELTAADFVGFGSAFEDPIAPTLTRIFGHPTDLDGNARVAVLFSPAVNRLTERQSKDGFIGGFFYGLDLLPGREHSNGGEVFYALVPDPEGRYGDARSRELVLATVPVILAHELVHMINFGERVLSRAAAGSETVWLAEGLAEMGEDRVGDAYAARGDGEWAAAFRSGNFKRARLFLAETAGTSLLTAAGTATLAERGASWLFLRYLTEQYGGDGLLGDLTRTTRIGTENVAAATARSWSALVLDWAVAVYDGDEAGIADPALADPRFRYRTLRPRAGIAAPGQPYPLQPVELDGGGTAFAAELFDGTVTHQHLVSPGPFTVSVSGGAPASPPSAGIALRVVRLR